MSWVVQASNVPEAPEGAVVSVGRDRSTGVVFVYREGHGLVTTFGKDVDQDLSADGQRYRLGRLSDSQWIVLRGEGSTAPTMAAPAPSPPPSVPHQAGPSRGNMWVRRVVGAVLFVIGVWSAISAVYVLVGVLVGLRGVSDAETQTVAIVAVIAATLLAGGRALWRSARSTEMAPSAPPAAGLVGWQPASAVQPAHTAGFAQSPTADTVAGGPIATKVCPDCAETVQAAARICRYCRYEFEAAATAMPANAQGEGDEGEATANDEPGEPVAWVKAPWRVDGYREVRFLATDDVWTTAHQVQIGQELSQAVHRAHDQAALRAAVEAVAERHGLVASSFVFGADHAAPAGTRVSVVLQLARDGVGEGGPRG